MNGRVLLALSVALALAAPLAADGPKPKAGLSFGGSTAAVRGKYLVSIMGCNDCHTPLKMGPKGPEPDQARLLAGHPAGMKMPPAPKLDGKGWGWAGAVTNTAFAGPWGVSYAANLTSDPDTGVGSWTDENFVKAMKTGKHLGVGRPILPPMPQPAYAHATEEDLVAVLAYLKTVPPVKNAVPEAQLAAPPR